MSKNKLKIRDKRDKGWFYLDNDYLNGYAKIFGAIGTAIYVSLCRHADNETQKCFPSHKKIAEELDLSRGTVLKYIKLFEQHNLISINKSKRKNGAYSSNIYTLLDKSEWKKTPHVQEMNKGACATDEQPTPQEMNTKDTNTKETNINNQTSSSKKKKKKPTNIQKVVNYFFELKGWSEEDLEKRKIKYSRYVRPAKELLILADDNVETVKDVLSSLKEWADKEDLEWSVETAIKRWEALTMSEDDVKEKKKKERQKALEEFRSKNEFKKYDKKDGD